MLGQERGRCQDRKRREEPGGKQRRATFCPPGCPVCARAVPAHRPGEFTRPEEGEKGKPADFFTIQLLVYSRKTVV